MIEKKEERESDREESGKRKREEGKNEEGERKGEERKRGIKIKNGKRERNV